MNFGPDLKDALKGQRPTYHLAPNFTTSPFPRGPLDLGTLVEDLIQYYPINQGAVNRVPIPADQRYVDAKEDVTASIKTSFSGEGSILAKVLDRSIGGDASLKGQKKDEDVYKIRKLETVYFCPQPRYIQECFRLSVVKDYAEMANYKAPVYLITGLKIAWGATISMERDRDFTGKLEGSAQVPGGPIDVQVKGQAGVSGSSGLISSFSEPADFVLGIQVQKIYYKRGFFSSERTLTVQRVARNAVLVDDEQSTSQGDAEEGEFLLAGLDDEEAAGLSPWTGLDNSGREERWLLPSSLIL